MEGKIWKVLVVSALTLSTFIGCNSSDRDSGEVSDVVTVTITPADNSVNVSANSVITLRFNHAMMDMGDMDEMFMLHQGWGIGSSQIPVTRTWSDEYTLLTIQPTSSLHENTTYTIHMEGMMMGMDGMMYHMMMDTSMGMGGMGNGMMMGGMSDDEIRTAFSTGPAIIHQISLDITQDAVFVADGGSGDIAVIDPMTNTLLGIQPIDSIGVVHHVYLSPDRTKLIVSDPNEDLSSGHGSSGGNGGHGGHGGGETMTSRIVLLDSRTLLETGRIVFEGMTHNAVMTPDGAYIMAANSMDNMVQKYSAVMLTMVGSYAVGDSPLELSLTPDGAHALTANSGDGTVSMIHLEGSGPTQQLSVGDVPIGAWLSPDATRAWVTNEQSKTISVITLNPFETDTTLVLNYTPGQAIQNPIRNELYVADEDNGSVHVLNLATLSWEAEIVTGERAHGIAFSPNGNRAFVTNELAGTVSAIDCDSRSVIATIVVGILPNGIVYRTAL